MENNARHHARPSSIAIGIQSAPLEPRWKTKGGGGGGGAARKSSMMQRGEKKITNSNHEPIIAQRAYKVCTMKTKEDKKGRERTK